VQVVLNHTGYSPEVSHRVLVDMAEHRKELEKKTKPILDTLRSYQDLPPVFIFLMLSVCFSSGVIKNFVEIILTFSVGWDYPG
jgi:hypothetical protein